MTMLCSSISHNQVRRSHRCRDPSGATVTVFRSGKLSHLVVQLPFLIGTMRGLWGAEILGNRVSIETSGAFRRATGW